MKDCPEPRKSRRRGIWEDEETETPNEKELFQFTSVVIWWSLISKWWLEMDWFLNLVKRYLVRRKHHASVRTLKYIRTSV